MKNGQKGITLIALVITIIVLLILAAVTIASLSGDNGIVDRGNEAKVASNINNAKDLIKVAVQEGTSYFYNVKYAGASDSLSQNTLGAFLNYFLTSKTTGKDVATGPVRDIIVSSSVQNGNDTESAIYTIKTNVLGLNNQPLEVIINAKGTITGWTND